jgi:hypothetical protein
MPEPTITHFERHKIEAGVLIPLVEASQPLPLQLLPPPNKLRHPTDGMTSPRTPATLLPWPTC